MVEKKEYTVRIGPLLRKALDMQKSQLREATYDVVECSDYEAGEILAKKLLKT